MAFVFLDKLWVSEEASHSNSYSSNVSNPCNVLCDDFVNNPTKLTSSYGFHSLDEEWRSQVLDEAEAGGKGDELGFVCGESLLGLELF